MTSAPASGGLSALSVEQQHRLRAGLAHVTRLGPRALSELVLQVAQEERDLAGTLDLLDQWRARLTVEMVAVAGADRFPPRPLQVAHG